MKYLKKSYARQYLAIGLLLVAIGVIIGGFVSLVGYLADLHPEKEPCYDEATQEIASLRSDSVTSGNFNMAFTLGTGTMGSDIYYFYYLKKGAGWKLARVISHQAVIYEDEETKPYIKKSYCGLKPQGTEIHVPKGTILKEYKL